MKIFALVALLLAPRLGEGSRLPHPDVLKAENKEQFLRAVSGRRRLAELEEPIPARDLQADSTQILADEFGGIPGFYHGVASGDPLPTQVILWTRYTPVSAGEEITLNVLIAKVDPNLAVEDHLKASANPNLVRAPVLVTQESGFVAKLDVIGLEPGTKYVFAFTDGVRASEVGLTQTAPANSADVASMTYAFFSCSHFSNGYFHAYDVASTITDLDLWIHVGDYFYEYGAYGTYAVDSPERRALTDPEWEPTSLNDYRRRMAQYHAHDEGLRNLRRRAPMMAMWDDHETTNNSYGQGTFETTGAENHQPVCPVNFMATDAEKNDAGCDRDENDVILRWNSAAQAYMEWIPVRRGPGIMGVVETTSLTQVIEWGNLATIVGFDTRISHRSKGPTLQSSWFSSFFPAFANTDVASYSDPSTEIGAQLQAAAGAAEQVLNDPSLTMIGENINVMRDAWQKSKSEGKIWQVWAGQTVLAGQVPPSLLFCGQAAPAAIAGPVQQYCDAVLGSDAGGLFRAAAAMEIYKFPWNSDDFGGFAVERAAILEVAKNYANNPVVLAGDVHDSWAYTLYEGGVTGPGEPVAAHLVCPGVTSPGWGPAIGPVFLGSPIEPLLGGVDGTYDFMEALFLESNPGLRYANIQNKGFVAVKMTHTEQVAEYIAISQEDILRNYDDARAASGKITSEFFCDASLVTTAGQPGSMEKQESCSATKFDASRPFFWDIPVEVLPVVANDPFTRCGFNACIANIAGRQVSTPRPTGFVPAPPPPTTIVQQPTRSPGGSGGKMGMMMGMSKNE